MRKTTVGMILGTPLYMAPEQCEGREDLDTKVDVYALGVLLYEQLAGRLPFTADTAAALMRQHMFKDPPDLAELTVGLPPALLELVHEMLTKLPTDRPTMSQVSERLERMTAETSGQRIGQPIRPSGQVVIKPRALTPRGHNEAKVTDADAFAETGNHGDPGAHGGDVTADDVTGLDPLAATVSGPTTPARLERPVTPQNSRRATPQGARAATPQSSRPATPQNSRAVTPQNSRPVTPQSTRPVTPSGLRREAPAEAEPAAEPAQDDVSTQSSMPPPPPRPERSRRPVVLGAVLVLVLGGGLGVRSLMHRDDGKVAARTPPVTVPARSVDAPPTTPPPITPPPEATGPAVAAPGTEPPPAALGDGEPERAPHAAADAGRKKLPKKAKKPVAEPEEKKDDKKDDKKPVPVTKPGSSIKDEVFR